MSPKLNATSRRTDNVLDQPPVAAGIVGRVIFSVLVVFLLVVGVGGWAAVAEISGAVITSGSVIIDGRTKKIQHREGGIVAAIGVKDGDRVAQGDVVVTLDSTQVKAEQAIIRSQLIEMRARQARLFSESRTGDTIEFAAELLSEPLAQPVINGERRLFNDARATRESQKEQLALRVVQIQREIEGVTAQRKAKHKELTLIEKELSSVQRLFAQNLTPATRVYALEREQTRLSGEHGTLLAQMARLEGQISEIRLQIINIDQNARTEAQRDLRNVEARIAELKERDVAQQDRLGRMEIRAPLKGIVQELQVHTIGGVVTSAEPIMTIVPDDQALSVEVRIAPAEIDQVHIGQTVRLRFSAFNQRSTPEKHGRIAFVSADVTHDAKNRVDYYAATVKLNKDEVFAIGDQPIQPGMPVEAFITTGTRTALSYLVKPLGDHLTRAMRED